MKPLGLYIHIPFCIRKCRYCDFTSYAGREDLMPQYVDALLKEAAMYHMDFAGHTADTVYIGGGTPSCLPEGTIDKLLKSLREVFNIAKDAQVTIELNPGTVDEAKLLEYRQSGFNRLSIGMQTDDDDLLRTLGRIHTYEEFLTAYDMAREAGFDNISTDLMFGLPGQTMEAFQKTLRNTIQINPEHISVYALKIEQGTAFYKAYHDKEIMDEETERRMYHLAVRSLKQAGYKQYETSNFAKKGCESRHNLKYWRLQETLGLGVAAHSYIIKDGKPLRSANTNKINDYFNAIKSQKLPAVQIQTIPQNEQMEEYIMLRLRLREGISYEDFHEKFGLDFQKLFQQEIEKTQKARLIHAGNKGLRPLLKGFDLQNALICEFIKKI